jgi:hypothetical protein
MVDQLEGIKDVHHALELLETLVDPLMQTRPLPVDLDRQQVGAWLRILNGEFAKRLGAVEGLMGTP